MNVIAAAALNRKIVRLYNQNRDFDYHGCGRNSGKFTVASPWHVEAERLGKAGWSGRFKMGHNDGFALKMLTVLSLLNFASITNCKEENK
jgi:hypothetical protein